MQIGILEIQRHHPPPLVKTLENTGEGLHAELSNSNKQVMSVKVENGAEPTRVLGSQEIMGVTHGVGRSQQRVRQESGPKWPAITNCGPIKDHAALSHNSHQCCLGRGRARLSNGLVLVITHCFEDGIILTIIVQVVDHNRHMLIEMPGCLKGRLQGSITPGFCVAAVGWLVVIGVT